MEIFTKHWSITLATIATVAGLGAMAVGMAYHADFVTIGQVVFVTGACVQLIKSHFAALSIAEKVKENTLLTEHVAVTIENVPEQTKAAADRLALEVKDAADTLARKVADEVAVLATSQEEIRQVVVTVKRQTNGMLDLITDVAKQKGAMEAEEISRIKAAELALVTEEDKAAASKAAAAGIIHARAEAQAGADKAIPTVEAPVTVVPPKP